MSYKTPPRIPYRMPSKVPLIYNVLYIYFTYYPLEYSKGFSIP